MKPEEESENKFGDINEDVCNHMQQREVDAMKSECWKRTVLYLIEKYGIKDDTIPDNISEIFRIALEEVEQTDGTHAVIQDALMEFRSEYNRLILSR